jgi:hypothetical protein
MNQELREKLGVKKLPNFQGVKVPIKLIREISDKNHNVLNRCIDVDMILEHIPELTHLTCVGHISHFHAFSEQVKAHYRIILELPNGSPVIQDMWKEQWCWCNDVYDLEKEAGIVD